MVVCDYCHGDTETKAQAILLKAVLSFCLNWFRDRLFHIPDNMPWRVRLRGTLTRYSLVVNAVLFGTGRKPSTACRSRA